MSADERLARYGHIGAAVNLQGRQEVAYRLERRLFDQGSAVVVMRDANPQAVESLVNSGFLVLGLGILDVEAVLHPGALPENDVIAARAVYDLLVRSRVITSPRG